MENHTIDGRPRKHGCGARRRSSNKGVASGTPLNRQDGNMTYELRHVNRRATGAAAALKKGKS